MIPDFDDNGYLPPGIHPATLDEIEQRFGQEDDQRRAGMESLRWLVDLAGRAGVLRIIINGSFVTDRYEPNDVDCALLIGDDYPVDPSAGEELEVGLPFLDLHIVQQDDFDEFIRDVYSLDRKKRPKGVLEVKP